MGFSTHAELSAGTAHVLQNGLLEWSAHAQLWLQLLRELSPR
jgi:hypothetical protein